ncbi:MFS transporter [Aureibacillus halotolerans]|uniref:Putative MFS family arabinose efflux permease n=1 Tax=Aureibacillus halotolerans TaxID=1508390 RepID=A0A4R6U5X1_9BACI|nr:MFS transporter [Aureibacillus halotolerans]TDQ41156.1 putative MFS family arabinose efflux permease [Aureibacillus halotolerans]
MFDILKEPTFRLAWISYTLSGAATSITPIALTLFLLDQYGGIEVLGVVLGARTLGFVLGAVLGVSIIDGYARRTVLVLSSVVRGVAVLCAMLVFDVSLPLLCIAILVAGLGEGMFRGAYQALIGEVVIEQQRQQANAVSTFSNRVLLVTGPALATVLYTFIGGPTTLLIISFFWLSSAWCAWFLPRASRPSSVGARANLFLEIGDVLREVLRHRWFIAGLAALSVWLTFGFSSQQLSLPSISRGVFGSDAFIGIALGSYSLGALGAALLMAKWTPRAPGVLAFVGLSLFAAVPMALTIMPESPMFGAVLVLLAYFLGGAGIEAFNIPWFSAIQREVAPDKLGRVFSFDFMVSYGIAPLGLIFLPFAMTAVGQTPVLLWCGLLTGAAALATLLVPGTCGLSDPRLDDMKR